MTQAIKRNPAVSFDPILLAPQQEEKEIFPYRPVWRTAIIEISILLSFTALTIVFTRLYKGTITSGQRQIFDVAFALIPVSLWLLISYQSERRAQQPRERIFTVVLLSALAANAIGIPLVERVFAVDQWLVTAPGLTRLIGYTLIAGIVQEFIKYAVIRYSVWPRCFRTRSDGIAYAMAAGIGYATVLNLNYTFTTLADPASSALRIAEFTLAQVAIGLIMGYLLAELNLSQDTTVFSLPAGLLLAAFLTGLTITVRGGLVVSNPIDGKGNPSSTGNSAVQGLGAAIFLVVLLFSAFYFLINNADERARLRSEFQR
jgi:RsiW-degrading membrane proteinase PrsW (M82 family)